MQRKQTLFMHVLPPVHSSGKYSRRRRDARSFAQSQDLCPGALESDLQADMKTILKAGITGLRSTSLPLPCFFIYIRESVLTCLCGPSARVTAAAAAAAQAGAALVQTISHQTWDAFSLRTVIQVMCSQHIFIQTSWEATATSLSFIL